MKKHKYYVYITTNPTRSTLYIGVTNNIGERLQEHYENRGNEKSLRGDTIVTISYIAKCITILKVS